MLQVVARCLAVVAVSISSLTIGFAEPASACVGWDSWTMTGTVVDTYPSHLEDRTVFELEIHEWTYVSKTHSGNGMVRTGISLVEYPDGSGQSYRVNYENTCESTYLPAEIVLETGNRYEIDMAGNVREIGFIETNLSPLTGRRVSAALVLLALVVSVVVVAFRAEPRRRPLKVAPNPGNLAPGEDAMTSSPGARNVTG